MRCRLTNTHAIRDYVVYDKNNKVVTVKPGETKVCDLEDKVFSRLSRIATSGAGAIKLTSEHAVREEAPAPVEKQVQGYPTPEPEPEIETEEAFVEDYEEETVEEKKHPRVRLRRGKGKSPARAVLDRIDVLNIGQLRHEAKTVLGKDWKHRATMKKKDIVNMLEERAQRDEA